MALFHSLRQVICSTYSYICQLCLTVISAVVAEPQVWLIGIELSTDKALENEKKIGCGGVGGGEGSEMVRY